AQRLRGVNCLSKEGALLYVGTFDDGLWLLEAGRWLHFQTGDGLASNRVVGVAAAGENGFVATDFGLSIAASGNLRAVVPARQKSFQTLITLPALTGLVSYNELLLLSRDDGELLAMDRDGAARGRAQVQRLKWPRPDGIAGSRLAIAG